MLRSPLHGLVSDHLLLLTVTGSKSGTEYTFPVGYEQDGETLYVTTYGTNWWKNLRGGGQDVTVRLRGERRTGHATVEEPGSAVAEYLHGYLGRRGRHCTEGRTVDRRRRGTPGGDAGGRRRLRRPRDD